MSVTGDDIKSLKIHFGMAIRKRSKRQTMIFKTLHRKLKIEPHEPH
jgi:hypothetical protein